MLKRRSQRGLTYMWMLFLVFLLGLGLGKSLEVYSLAVQREKEADLLYVGKLYRAAIRDYYLSSPAGPRRYPARLDELLRDPRSLAPRRYLRQLYPDPVTGKEWEPVLAPEGGIWGVRSRSTRTPLRTVPPETVTVQAGGGRAYADWQFVYAGAPR